MNGPECPSQNHGLLDAALSYAGRGWYVFPLYEMAGGACACGMPCGRNAGKHPRTEHGVYDATIEVAQIQHWWATWPRANIAIATGARSKLVVFDTDPRNGGDVSRDDLLHSYGAFPATPQVLTGGGGLHDYFFFDGDLPTFKPAAGIDVLGSGGYVAAPPSLHASGRRYEWEASSHPDECPLAPLPDWLRVLGESKGYTPLACDTLPDVLPIVPLQDVHVSPRIKFVIQTGRDCEDPARYTSRSEAVFAVITALVQAGHDDATIAGIVLDPQYAISAKPLEQHRPKARVAAEIARARAKGHTETPSTVGAMASTAVHEASHHRNGHTPGPEPTDPATCPELPACAKVDDARAAEASIYLDDYIAFSKTWAPRAYEGFHEAAALFALSTAAARRVKIQLGPRGVYTSLYIALAARTSLYTKTTCVDIALGLLRRTGLASLLADDDATPQAFLRSLTLYIPSDYGDMTPEAQEALRQRLAFAGQKSWFYEEFGQHLHSMMQKEGLMAQFRSILRRLDDHQEEYTYATIGRGRDVLTKPYVSLVANVTPADLKPFLRSQSPLWRDGYLARFAFVAPGDAPTTVAPFPEGEMTYPRPLLTELASWHKRLGIPRVVLEPISDEKGKATGRYQALFMQPHHETTYTLSPAVRTAFYAYDEALHTLMAQTTNEDLDGSYARFPMKALRIAGILASLHDDSGKHIIWPAQWYRGQQIVERWRRDLHKVIHQVGEADEMSRESKGEQRILAVVRKHGALSAMALHKWTKLAHADILQHVTVLEKAGALCAQHTGRTKKYHLPGYTAPVEVSDEV